MVCSIQLLKKAELERGDAIAWAAYHMSQQLPMYGLQDLCALLPLFYEKSATPPIVRSCPKATKNDDAPG